MSHEDSLLAVGETNNYRLLGQTKGINLQSTPYLKKYYLKNKYRIFGASVTLFNLQN
jgi:hypothetical protein